MPKFFFTVINDHGMMPDVSEHVFPNADTAVADAGRAATQLLEHELDGRAGGVSFKLFVEDEGRTRLATVNVVGTVIR